MSLSDYAKQLAIWHKQNDAQLSQVLLYEDPENQEVRLVEVTGSVDPIGEAVPFRFAANPERGAPYPTVLVLLSPSEKSKLDNDEIALPESWTTSRELPLE